MSFGYQVEYILIYLSIFKIFKELVFICNHDSRKKLELKKKKLAIRPLIHCQSFRGNGWFFNFFEKIGINDSLIL